jgi:hypothetical protein
MLASRRAGCKFDLSLAKVIKSFRRIPDLKIERFTIDYKLLTVHIEYATKDRVNRIEKHWRP